MDKNKFVVIIPSYNNERWYEKNLSSLLSQDYDNFRSVYVDDCSKDRTAELVQSYIEKNNAQDKITFIKNDVRVGAMQNIYDVVHSSDDNEIAITLDGDDWFEHSSVISRVNEEYKNPECWMTYGQYKSQPDGRIGCSQQIPIDVITNSSHRSAQWRTSHLRTFFSWLFKKIKKEDFLDHTGKFYPMAWDLAMMFPMLEMSGHHSKFIPDVLYAYNVDNPINDSKVSLQQQQDTERIIRRKIRYDRI